MKLENTIAFLMLLYRLVLFDAFCCQNYDGGAHFYYINFNIHLLSLDLTFIF